MRWGINGGRPGRVWLRGGVQVLPGVRWEPWKDWEQGTNSSDLGCSRLPQASEAFREVAKRP